MKSKISELKIVLFACLFGAILLGENILKWQYLAAFVLICSGIVLGNKAENAKK